MKPNILQQDNGPNQDSDWIRGCQNGEETAFEKLVDKYQRNLFNIVYRHIGDPAEVEDIVQKILLKVYFSLPKFDLRSPFFPWLYRIAINQCYDELRRIRRRRIVRFSDLSLRDADGIETLLNRSQRQSPPDEDGRLLHALLYRMLDRLSQKQRRVIVLRDLEQLPYERIAELLGCTEQAARLKVMRARARLRGLMGKALRRRELYARHPDSWPKKTAHVWAAG